MIHQAGRAVTPAPTDDTGLRIGFDTRNLVLPEATGVGTYAANLSKACAALGYRSEFLSASSRLGSASRFVRALRHRARLSPHLAAPDVFRIGQQHFDFYGKPLRLTSADAPALMHWTYPLPLYLAGIPNIVTIHDLIPLTNPELTGIDGARMRRILDGAIGRAAAVVTVSETVRQQIITHLNVAPSRVWNLYQATDMQMVPAPSICPPGSFLVVGTVEPRKNIARLVAAHAASGVRRQLVIIGPDGPGAQQALAGAGAGIIRLSHVPRSALIRAIAEARAVLFPSLAEGFGLPIAEGMTLGIPVMTSLGGATEEIAGGAALLIDPTSIDDMTRAITQLEQDDSMCDQLRAAGLERSRLFSMAAYTERLWPFYSAILRSTSSGGHADR